MNASNAVGRRDWQPRKCPKQCDEKVRTPSNNTENIAAWLAMKFR